MGSYIKSHAKPTCPEQMIVHPISGNHEQTFILLHGRGSDGETFGAHLLMTFIPDFESLQSAFPNAKFFFPTASPRKALVLQNQTINQFFDIWSLRDPDERDEMQFDGLRESNDYIQDLLRTAVSEVGAENVVLWGLSQGCAVALITLLSWNGPPFAAVVGMCGWMPLRTRLTQRISTLAENDKALKLHSAASCLDDILTTPVDLQCQRTTTREIPVFLGHGVLDPKVLVDLGRQAHSFLEAIGLEASWREYEGLGHWYSGPMLRDIIVFLQNKVGKVAPLQ